MTNVADVTAITAGSFYTCALLNNGITDSFDRNALSLNSILVVGVTSFEPVTSAV
jgi:hypothetical protein